MLIPSESAERGATLDPDFMRHLEAEISRFKRSRTATFDDALERHYERETHESRTRDLNITMMLGGICFLLTALTDIAFVPDIGFDGVLIRVGALPLFLVVIVFGPQMEPMHREMLMVVAGTVLVLLLAYIPLLSSAPQAALSFMCAIFAIAFGNTTVVPRFRHACIFTALSCIGVGALSIYQGPYGWAITIELLLVGLFTLFANYRIERGARLEYLLGEHEKQRAAGLSAEREKLKILSETDALTGVANRAAFNNYWAALYADPAYAGRSAALLLLDVDHFKAYNDHYGHIAGDDCLRAVASKISSTLRNEGDLVARYGGEEFVVCVLDVSPAQARIMAKRLCGGIRALQIPHDGREDGIGYLTVSIGIATGEIAVHGSIRELIAAADEALYIAKNNGRNRVEVALPDAA